VVLIWKVLPEYFSINFGVGEVERWIGGIWDIPSLERRLEELGRTADRPSSISSCMVAIKQEYTSGCWQGSGIIYEALREG